MANKKITGRDFSEGSVIISGTIAGNIVLRGRDIAEEAIAGGAVVGDATVSPSGTTESIKADDDLVSGDITVSGFTGDLILVGRDFAAGCVASGGNSVSGKAQQVGRSLASTLVAAAAGGATVFTVSGLGNDYDGDYWDSGEVDNTYSNEIYTNGTRYTNGSSFSSSGDVGSVFANLADAKSHSSLTYQITDTDGASLVGNPWNSGSGTGYIYDQITNDRVGSSTAVAAVAPPATVFTVSGVGNDYDGDYYDSGNVNGKGGAIFTNGTRFADDGGFGGGVWAVEDPANFYPDLTTTLNQGTSLYYTDGVTSDVKLVANDSNVGTISFA